MEITIVRLQGSQNVRCFKNRRKKLIRVLAILSFKMINQTKNLGWNDEFQIIFVY